jgi:hypothetical protein
MAERQERINDCFRVEDRLHSQVEERVSVWKKRIWGKLSVAPE